MPENAEPDEVSWTIRDWRVALFYGLVLGWIAHSAWVAAAAASACPPGAICV